MMPQKEVNETIHQQEVADYGRYEGHQTSSAYQHNEPPYEQELRAGSSGKVYPLQRDKTNILCFSLAVIALGLILLFGVLFVVVVGGTTGWASFAVACIAILFIAGIGIIAIKTH